MSRRIESITVGAAIVAVATAVGLILWAGLGVNRSYAGLAAIAAAAALVLVAARTRRTTGEAETQRRLANVERALKRVDARFVELSARIAEIDQKAGETGRATARAVSSELDSIARVVRDLAETVALHDAEIAGAREQPRPAPAQTQVVAERGPRPPDPAPVEAQPPARPEPQPQAAAPPAREEPPVPSDLVVRAIVGDRLSLFLQPAVGVASRKVQLYELLGRVARPGSAGHVQARDVAAVAVRHGLLGQLETLLVRDALRVARHLRSRGRDVPVLVPVSLPTLGDPALYEILDQALRGDPQLGTGIALQIRQEQWDQLGGLEEEAAESIRRLGVRFAVDDVRDLRLDVGELVRHGVRYVRASAGVLLAAAEGNVPSDIHPHDVPGLLSRHGIEMVVTGVEQERTLVELFEFGLQLGQGEFFSAPRAVRPDVLSVTPERPGEAAPPPAGEPAATTETVVEKAEPAPARLSLRSVLRRSGA
ncbi:MAG TPA: EAL domain-containing protein [Casimicrobiaceae bacterium]